MARGSSIKEIELGKWQEIVAVPKKMEKEKLKNHIKRVSIKLIKVLKI